MLANQPSSVFAVASGFGPEARRVRGHLDRQARAVEDFVRVDVRQRHFGGRDQIESTLVGELEQIGFELGKLTGAKQRVRSHDERRQHFFVAVPLRLQLETEVYKRSFESRAQASEN